MLKRYQREYKYAGTSEMAKLSFDGFRNVRFGGSDEPNYTVIQPSAPAVSAPTASASLQDWIDLQPQMYEANAKYAPLYAKLNKDLNAELYPTTSGIQETLAKKAVEGMASGVPSVIEDYMSDKLKSQFGRNLVYNPQAQESYGINMANMKQDYQNYWTNLALTLAGRQPITTASNIGSVSPESVMSYNQNNWSQTAQLMQPRYMPNYNQTPAWASALGAIGGGMAGVGSMYSAFNPASTSLNFMGVM